MSRPRRLVTAAFLAKEDLVALGRRPAGVQPGSWLLEQVRVDGRLPGEWSGPLPHVAKRAHVGRVVVSLLAQDEVQARRRCGGANLSAYLRGLVRHGPGASIAQHNTSKQEEEEMKFKRNSKQAGPELGRGGAPRKPGVGDARGARPERRPHVEVGPVQPVAWAVAERLLELGSAAWPPTRFYTKIGHRTGADIEASVAGLAPGGAVRLVFGAAPEEDEVEGHDETEIPAVLAMIVQHVKSAAKGRIHVAPHAAPVPFVAEDDDDDEDPDDTGDSWSGDEDGGWDDADDDEDSEEEDVAETAGEDSCLRVLVVTVTRRA